MTNKLENQGKPTAKERVIERELDLDWFDLDSETREEIKNEAVEEIARKAPLEEVIMNYMESKIEDEELADIFQSSLLRAGIIIAATTTFTLLAIFGIGYGIVRSVPSLSALGAFFLGVIFYHLWRWRKVRF